MFYLYLLRRAARQRRSFPQYYCKRKAIELSLARQEGTDTKQHALFSCISSPFLLCACGANEIIRFTRKMQHVMREAALSLLRIYSRNVQFLLSELYQDG